MDPYTMKAEKMPLILEIPGAKLYGQAVDGMSFNYWVIDQKQELGPVLKGLPHDSCPCPHWGLVIKGRIDLTYPDGKKQTVKAGECCYMPPNHNPVIHAGTTFFDLSPTKEFNKVMNHVKGILAKM